MTTEEWRRAGEIVAERMKELGLSAPQLAEKAHVDPTTVRTLLRGQRWPRRDTRDRIMQALDWPAAEVTRRVWGGLVAVENATTEELIHELCRRFGGHGVHASGTSHP